jgi:hypothetical protein
MTECGRCSSKEGKDFACARALPQRIARSAALRRVERRVAHDEVRGTADLGRKIVLDVVLDDVSRVTRHAQVLAGELAEGSFALDQRQGIDAPQVGHREAEGADSCPEVHENTAMRARLDREGSEDQRIDRHPVPGLGLPQGNGAAEQAVGDRSDGGWLPPRGS